MRVSGAGLSAAANQHQGLRFAQLRASHLTNTIKPIEAVYKLVRSVCPTLEDDRYISPDINNITQLVRSGQVWSAAKDAILESNPDT